MADERWKAAALAAQNSGRHLPKQTGLAGRKPRGGFRSCATPALICGMQGLRLHKSWRGYGEAYSNYRDACMAENVQWIVKQEQALGGAVMLAAHNGHVAKSWTRDAVPMGELLAQRYGSDYYAVGTVFFTAEVNISTSTMVAAGYERKNHFFCSADPLGWQARRFEGGRHFLDFAAVPHGSALYERLSAVTGIGEGDLWLWRPVPGEFLPCGTGSGPMLRRDAVSVPCRGDRRAVLTMRRLCAPKDDSHTANA